MSKLHVLGAIALSSFISAAAFADNPRTITFPANGHADSVICQVASADAATGATEPGLCVLPENQSATISVRHLK
jgi:hypothetical protein